MAGNVYTPEVAGSLEIAVVRLGCPLILVLGHTDCTAVHLAHRRERVDGRAGDVTRLIRRAIDDANAHSAEEAIEANVRATIRALRERSRRLREREEAGELRIAGGIYDLATGRVRLIA